MHIVRQNFLFTSRPFQEKTKQKQQSTRKGGSQIVRARRPLRSHLMQTTSFKDKGTEVQREAGRVPGLCGPSDPPLLILRAVCLAGNICRHLLLLVQCPTLIVHGEKDPLVPRFHADFIHEHVRGSR